MANRFSSLFVFIVLIGIAAPALRAQSTLPPLSHDEMALIRKIEGRIMAPCCYTQTIRDHDSQVAVDMRSEVTTMVASGKSEGEIITYYRTKYGETILVVPDGATGGMLTYTPVMIFLVSVGLLLFFIKKTASTRDAAIWQLVPERTEPETLALREKIRAEIGEGW
jgi:cytochrome c-type biogenesis protein CcmH